MEQIKVKAILDRIVVKSLEAETKTEGGILIPESSQEKPLRGKIVAHGDGKVYDNGYKRPMAVKVGDEIMYGKHAGMKITVEGEDLLVMTEDDVIGIFN